MGDRTNNNTQAFHFLRNVNDPESKIEMSPNLNLMPHDDIKREFISILQNQGIAVDAGRQVALGSFGDVVIYENSVIDMVADSG
jgi:hypothetical protein